MNKRIISVIVLLISLIGLLFYLIIAPEGEQEKLDLIKTKEEVLDEINSSKEYVKKTSEWKKAETPQGDIAYFNPPRKKNEQQDPKKDVAKYFITGLMTEDVDIFISSFYVQTISEDLFKRDVDDKTLVAKEIMNRISRNGQLQEIRYVDKKGIFNSETGNFSLIFIYKDGKQATITLRTIPLDDSEGEQEDTIFVITTSAWNIIEQIEARTE